MPQTSNTKPPLEPASPATKPRDPSPRLRLAARLRVRREALTGYVFVLPALLLFGLVGVYPVVYSFLLSFHQWNGFSPQWTWVGLDNFKDLLYANSTLSSSFWNAALNNLVVLVALPIGVIAISLPVAVTLNTVRRFSSAFRTVFFLPMVTAGIATYYTWRWLYEPDGVINSLLRSTGLGALAPAQGFLGDIHTALPAVIVVMIWSNAPLAIILYITGLQTIDSTLFDAARVDGATPSQILFKITWPLLLPVTGIVILVNFSAALLQGFEIPLLMTGGGPAEHTNVLGLAVYANAFQLGKLGLASAIGWLLFWVGLVFALVNLRLTRHRD